VERLPTTLNRTLHFLYYAKYFALEKAYK